ncbi:hypothetical protein UVI_02006920 [Ustilaginoidea virens]|nr:hypothetical protein UVI_02006920 [Ustilaginoidea virens]
MITPPPGPGLMLGGAKAELLRREDYSFYANVAKPQPQRTSSGSLWQSPASSPSHAPASPSASDGEGSIDVSALGPALPGQPDLKEGYMPPRPLYAVSSSGSIPEGFVAHARDACVSVDYQWDSMRPPFDFGDGGKLGEEWASMHKRFRGGVKRLINWYASTDSPADVMGSSSGVEKATHFRDSDGEVETVVIMVSHGAGCNALIGAITHQPVLMDIGVASITMASRKQNLDYAALLASTPSPADASKKKKILVPVDKMYDIRLSASTEHLRRSNTTTPVFTRSASTAGTRNTMAAAAGAPRGRTSTMGGPVMSPFTYSDPFSPAGSRSTSTSAIDPPNIARRETASHRPLPRGTALASVGFGKAAAGWSKPGNPSTTGPASTIGLWSAGPSSLRLMDDGSDDTDEFDTMLPDFDRKRFDVGLRTKDKRRGNLSLESICSSATDDDAPVFPDFPQPGGTPLHNSATAPMLAGPIKLHTKLGLDNTVEEIKATQLGAGVGGLWGIPPPLDEAERFRDLSQTKRRWTVNERA